MIDILQKILYVFLGLGFIALVAWLVFPSSQKAAESIAETNPAKQRPLGEIFVRDFLGIPKCGLLGGGCSDRFPDSSTSTPSKNDTNARFSSNEILVTNLRNGATLTNGFVLEGEAKNTWFYEGIARGEIKNEKEQTVGAFIIKKTNTAQGSTFSSWNADIRFSTPGTRTGYIVLKNANPSGDIKNEKVLWVPVVFSGQGSVLDKVPNPVSNTPVPKACRVSGCNGEICSDQDVVSTCMFRPEYACYQQARCERQSNGECGFTPSPALAACINNAQSGQN